MCYLKLLGSWAVAVVVCLTLTGTSLAQAATWSLQRPAVYGADLLAVSCTSSSACVAIGGGSLGPVGARWDGVRWHPCSATSGCSNLGSSTPNGDKVLPDPNPHGENQTSLNGVSCTSSTGCIAVGTYSENSPCAVAPCTQPFAERWNGVRWSLDLGPKLAGHQTGGFGAILSKAT